MAVTNRGKGWIEVVTLDPDHGGGSGASTGLVTGALGADKGSLSYGEHEALKLLNDFDPLRRFLRDDRLSGSSSGLQEKA